MGQMRLTKTAGQARLIQAKVHLSDDNPSDLLDWEIVDAYNMST